MARSGEFEDGSARIAPEVRTHRLVVVDAAGQERIVGEVVNGDAELRLNLPGTGAGRSTSLLLFTSAASDSDQGASLGFQLWVDGDAVLGLSAYRESRGNWVTDVQID